jgi:hypothetical protein
MSCPNLALALAAGTSSILGSTMKNAVDQLLAEIHEPESGDVCRADVRANLAPAPDEIVRVRDQPYTI